MGSLVCRVGRAIKRAVRRLSFRQMTLILVMPVVLNVGLAARHLLVGDHLLIAVAHLALVAYGGWLARRLYRSEARRRVNVLFFDIVYGGTQGRRLE
jgi:hypothetical protein